MCGRYFDYGRLDSHIRMKPLRRGHNYFSSSTRFSMLRSFQSRQLWAKGRKTRSMKSAHFLLTYYVLLIFCVAFTILSVNGITTHDPLHIHDRLKADVSQPYESLNGGYDEAPQLTQVSSQKAMILSQSGCPCMSPCVFNSDRNTMQCQVHPTHCTFPAPAPSYEVSDGSPLDVTTGESLYYNGEDDEVSDKKVSQRDRLYSEVNEAEKDMPMYYDGTLDGQSDFSTENAQPSSAPPRPLFLSLFSRKPGWNQHNMTPSTIHLPNLQKVLEGSQSFSETSEAPPGWDLLVDVGSLIKKYAPLVYQRLAYTTLFQEQHGSRLETQHRRALSTKLTSPVSPYISDSKHVSCQCFKSTQNAFWDYCSSSEKKRPKREFQQDTPASSDQESLPPPQRISDNIFDSTNSWCHSSCATCLPVPSLAALRLKREEACLSCGPTNTTTRGLVRLVPTRENARYGRCVSITSDPSHCHSDCATCRGDCCVGAADSCVTCPVGAVLKYLPTTFPFGRCIWVENLRVPALPSSTIVTPSELLPTITGLFEQSRFPVDLRSSPEPALELMPYSAAERDHIRLPITNQNLTSQDNQKHQNDQQHLDGITLDPRYQPWFLSLDSRPLSQRLTESPDNNSNNNNHNVLEDGTLGQSDSLGRRVQQKKVSHFVRLPSEPTLPASPRCQAIAHYLEDGGYSGQYGVAGRYWTQMVFLHADNNIQDAGIHDLMEMRYPSNPKDFKPGHGKHVADFMHLVVLIDTRRDKVAEDSMFDKLFRTWWHGTDGSNSINIGETEIDVKATRDDATSQEMESIVVCPNLAITDQVTYHNIDPTNGEAFELYRVPHFSKSGKRSNYHLYDWLLLRRRGEVNMNDPAILADFITRTMQRFPALYFSLVLWDHGSAWAGFGDDEDNRDGNNMSLTDIAEGIARGLENARAITKVWRLNVLGFDACLMNEYSVVEALSSFTDYFIASEDNEPSVGWDWKYLTPGIPYEDAKGRHSIRPATPFEYTQRLVEGYAKAFSRHQLLPVHALTISVIETSVFELFNQRFKFVLKSLLACGGSGVGVTVQKMATSLPRIDACATIGLCACLDLGTFLAALIQEALSSGFDRSIISQVVAAQALYNRMVVIDMDNYADAAPKEKRNPPTLGFTHGNGKTYRPTGMSIYFPFSGPLCSDDNRALSNERYYLSSFSTTWSSFSSDIRQPESGAVCSISLYRGDMPSTAVFSDNPFFGSFTNGSVLGTQVNPATWLVRSRLHNFHPYLFRIRKKKTEETVGGLEFSSWIPRTTIVTRSLFGVVLDNNCYPSFYIDGSSQSQRSRSIKKGLSSPSTVLLTRLQNLPFISSADFDFSEKQSILYDSVQKFKIYEKDFSPVLLHIAAL